MARLAVRVQPGARRAALLGRLAGGEWKMSVNAPPEGGRANEAVEALLAGWLGLKRRQVQVTRGASSRSKQIELTGIEADEAERRLAAHLAATADAPARGAGTRRRPADGETTER